jgi:hypothetical protein
VTAAETGGAWPTPPQELLLRAAVAPGPEATGAWERWLERDAPDTRDLHSQRLLPLVYRNLSAAGARADAYERLREAYRTWWFRNQLLVRRGTQAIGRLQAAGLPTLVLKGLPLGLVYYDDLGARPMADVDVLVPRGRAMEAMAVLEAGGARAGGGWAAGSREAQVAMRVQHAEPFTDGDGLALDLHWTVLRQPVAPEDFWDHSAPFTASGLELRRLCTADQLLHVCVHGADGGQGGIRWAADALVVLRAEDLDWQRLLEVARRQQVGYTVAEALDYLRAAFSADVPPEVLAALREAASRREARAHRAAVLPATPIRMVQVVWDRYRRLSELEGHRPNPLGFPTYMQQAMGFRDHRALVRTTLRRAADYPRRKV